jgi:DNA-binding transcriptional LysR family regulator
MGFSNRLHVISQNPDPPLMNIHHLELFYYVARHGGITEAVRNIPYGIQQPAVSAQILQLEDSLGVTLFRRRPFALNAPGEKLYQFIKPFFDGVEAVGDEIRGDSQQFRVGGSGILLRDHLPEVLLKLQARFPRLKLSLREGHRPQLENWLRNQELDVATTLLDGKPAGGLNATPLMELRLVLLVNKSARIKSADDLWKRDKINESLICLPAFETIPRQFQAGLNRLGVAWLPSIEVSSLALIETYVAWGYGVGLYVDIPRYSYLPKIRVLPLDDFDPVVLGATWPGKITPLIEAYLEELRQRIKTFTSDTTPLPRR